MCDPLLTCAIPACFRNELLMIQHYTNLHFYFTLLDFTTMLWPLCRSTALAGSPSYELEALRQCIPLPSPSYQSRDIMRWWHCMLRAAQRCCVQCCCVQRSHCRSIVGRWCNDITCSAVKLCLSANSIESGKQSLYPDGDLDYHQNFIICSLAHCQPSLEISCKSVRKLFVQRC